MRQELVRVHNDNDRLEERLSALEAEQAAKAKARDSKPTQPSHPPLKVVRLEPEEVATPEPESTVVTASQLASPDATKGQDSSPRPMIKGTGQKVFSTHGGAASSPETPVKPASTRGGS